MIGRPTRRDRVSNGLMCELHFPEQVHKPSPYPFELRELGRLPDVNDLARQDHLLRLWQKFEELHDGCHPLRVFLNKLQTLDTVRIIEGEA
jgi:hypothetical protein